MSDIPAYSQTLIARTLAQNHGQDWRYVADMGQWLHWNGSIWQPDETNLIYDLASKVCCDFAARVPRDGKLARSLASNVCRNTVVNLLATDQRLVLLNTQLDVNPLLLGTPAGIVDLHTGKMMPASREHMVTMSTLVSPAESGTGFPQWAAFLESTFPLIPGRAEPDYETIKFIQRWTGYSATGLNRKHHYAFLLGRGRNGKGILLNTVRRILGDYACALASESLMERIVQPHRQEFAGLRGKRFVTSSEISQGRHWNEAILDQLSGADPIKANFMRQNEFSFDSVAKLWIAANHMPVFRSVDTHVTERLILVWMRMRFLESVKGHGHNTDVKPQDDELDEKLKPEYPVILRWIIEGARMVLAQGQGLNIPDSLKLAGQNYLATEDALGSFVTIHCVSIQGSSPLHDLWEFWNVCRRQDGEKPHTKNEFRKMIEVRYVVKHQNYGTAVFGLALNDMARAKLLNARQQKDERQERNASTW
jgi:putative DNA primase/helicase